MRAERPGAILPWALAVAANVLVVYKHGVAPTRIDQRAHEVRLVCNHARRHFGVDCSTTGAHALVRLTARAAQHHPKRVVVDTEFGVRGEELPANHLGKRVYGFRFRVQGLRMMFWGPGFRV